MALTDNIRETLLSCYNASYGGKYELAGRIENLEKLAQSGFVSFSSARAKVIETQQFRAKGHPSHNHS